MHLSLSLYCVYDDGKVSLLCPFLNPQCEPGTQTTKAGHAEQNDNPPLFSLSLHSTTIMYQLQLGYHRNHQWLLCMSFVFLLPAPPASAFVAQIASVVSPSSDRPITERQALHLDDHGATDGWLKRRMGASIIVIRTGVLNSSSSLLLHRGERERAVTAAHPAGKVNSTTVAHNIHTPPPPLFHGKLTTNRGAVANGNNGQTDRGSGWRRGVGPERRCVVSVVVVVIPTEHELQNNNNCCSRRRRRRLGRIRGRKGSHICPHGPS